MPKEKKKKQKKYSYLGKLIVKMQKAKDKE